MGSQIIADQGIGKNVVSQQRLPSYEPNINRLYEERPSHEPLGGPNDLLYNQQRGPKPENLPRLGYARLSTNHSSNAPSSGLPPRPQMYEKGKCYNVPQSA